MRHIGQFRQNLYRETVKKSTVFIVMLMTITLSAENNLVPNASFEKGDNQPSGWKLSGGQGQWSKSKKTDACVMVTGNGKSLNYWSSQPLDFQASTLYEISFNASAIDNKKWTDGTAISGPSFCNRDLGKLENKWINYSSVFFSPETINSKRKIVRFGQWHITGTIAYDNIEIVKAKALYRKFSEFNLGTGESIKGNSYIFCFPTDKYSLNHSRPLFKNRCSFNTNRWVFYNNDYVIYRHRIGNRKQLKVNLSLNISWYNKGELFIELSKDGQNWKLARKKHDRGRISLTVPPELLPAKDIWVRLRVKPKPGKNNSELMALQVKSYEYRATIDGESVDFCRGKTQYFTVSGSNKIDTELLSMGQVIPGINKFTAVIDNKSSAPVKVSPFITLSKGKDHYKCPVRNIKLKPGKQFIELDYNIPATGKLDFKFDLGADFKYSLSTKLYIPELFNNSYGSLLPGTSAEVGLWWASSGWKVPQKRILPKARSKAVVITLAKNETEAAQFVLSPKKNLTGLKISLSDFRGTGNSKIPASAIDILQVAYVPVVRPTDKLGESGMWPDPLPPVKGKLNIAANKNQPFWIRVKASKGIKAGTYNGVINLSAKNYSAEVPIKIVVYDFTLPDKMTCKTAIDCNMNTVWKYQKIKNNKQRRIILNKYFENFKAHHISPHYPAPLDNYSITWPSGNSWIGGKLDSEIKYSGDKSLKLFDNNPKRNIHASYQEPIAINKNGFRLRFRYKTDPAKHETIVTFRHLDAEGKWMSGKNRNMRLSGDKEWKLFDQTITEFPEGAKSISFMMWATLYKDDGSPTGAVWFDDISLKDLSSGNECFSGGNFELNIKPKFNWKAWDKAMTRAFDYYHFNSFRLPIRGLGGGDYHSRREPEFLGYKENSPAYKIAFRNYLHGIQEHLRRKGWLDKAYIYWFDEPTPKDYKFVMNGFNKLKKYAPDINRLLTEEVQPELIGGPNIWCPLSRELGDMNIVRKRQQTGDIFWWYICTVPKSPYAGVFIDHPGTEMRVWLWQTWKHKISGILIWRANFWTSSAAYPSPSCPQNPYKDPMSWSRGYGEKPGTQRPWGNGDGRLIYPPLAAADGSPEKAVMEGPVDSIRWEMLRDGVEDYEYLAILKSQIKAKRNKLSKPELEHYESLLMVPDSISKNLTSFTTNPETIEKRRETIAKAIVELKQK